MVQHPDRARFGHARPVASYIDAIQLASTGDTFDFIFEPTATGYLLATEGARTMGFGIADSVDEQDAIGPDGTGCGDRGGQR